MKYKITANDTVMGENLTASKALNMLCNILKANVDALNVKVYYLNSKGVYQLENQFKVVEN